MLTSPNPDTGWSRETICLNDALVLPASASVYCRDQHIATAALFRRERVFRGGAVETLPMPVGSLPGRHLWAGVAFEHFGLFVTESLSRLWAIDDSIESVIFTPRHYSRKAASGLRGYQDELVKLAGIDCAVTVLFDPTLVQELVVPGQGFGLGAISFATPEFRAFAARIGSHILPAGQPRVYLSRSRVPRTRGGILGERTIEQNLARQGYRIFHPQDETIANQIAQYKAATHIIGPDGSAFHLAGLVAREEQKFGIIRRRRSGDIDLIMSQLRGMGVRPHPFDCLQYDWLHPRRGRPGDESWGELDHTLLGRRLAAEGFIAEAAGWQVPGAAERDAELDGLAATYGAPMKRL
jgi:hypothetical protein